MTPQEEALDVMKRLRIVLATSKVDGIRVLEPISMAIEALQKQIPTLPIYSCPDFMCPKCKTYGIEDLDREKLDYCPNCGQAIDWGETK